MPNNEALQVFYGTIKSDVKTAMTKLFDIDNRVSRIEDKLGITPR